MGSRGGKYNPIAGFGPVIRELYIPAMRANELKLILRRADLEQIVAQARRDYPHETCGLIGGRAMRAEMVRAVPNVSAAPRSRFEMERRQMVETILAFQRAGQDVVAIYHSHPDSAAEPSATDIAEATWPDAVYLIVGNVDKGTPEVRGWSIRRGKALPAGLIVLD